MKNREKYVLLTAAAEIQFSENCFSSFTFYYTFLNGFYGRNNSIRHQLCKKSPFILFPYRSNSLTKQFFRRWRTISSAFHIQTPQSRFLPANQGVRSAALGSSVRHSLKSLAVRSHTPGRDLNEGGSPVFPDPHQTPGSAQIPGRLRRGPARDSRSPRFPGSHLLSASNRGAAARASPESSQPRPVRPSRGTSRQHSRKGLN